MRCYTRYLATDYSRGRFQFNLLDDGNLGLYTTNFPTDLVNSAYWSTQAFGTGFSLIFNLTGYIILRANNGTVISTISSNTLYSTQDFYQRAVLDYDGVFRHYIYPKNSGSSTGSWSTFSVTPSNICLRVNGAVGSGACGLNSYCTFEDEHKMVLIDWVYDCFHYEKLELLMEDDEEAQIDMKKVEEYVKIGIWCIQEDPSARPTMKQVVQMLEGFMDVSNPPYLSSFTR
ncbi:hypothetical protein K1719_000123 [Acacia pycnantha]|nr:hypothetical protein K1719_000123 [Acacia pycnantha]